MEEPYKKPVLKFFEITKGKSKAGELLAAFELIELDYSGFGEVCPSDFTTICSMLLPAKFYHMPITYGTFRALQFFS